jgi:conjugative element/phage-associated large polyvalent protein
VVAEDVTQDKANEEGRRRSNGDPAPANGRPSARRAARAPPENAILAGRERHRARPKADPAAGAAENLKPEGSKVGRADSDPWSVPESVRDRFVQDGHRFYFPDGAPAFRDRGRRLTTTSENTQVVHSLIEIARARGWNEITVTGTERFRHEAWRQGRLAGLTVRGFRPSEEQHAQFMRALGRNLASPAGRTDAISEQPSVGAPSPSDSPPAAREPSERITGKLLDHGPDTYRHDPDAEASYFVRLGIPGGYREVWGKDIERAVAKSLTQPKIGDAVILQRTGQDPVTVKRRERDAEGALAEKEVPVFRNRWVIEKQEFFEERKRAASVVRNEAIQPTQAVRERPELAGTYLSLKAAELASRRLRHPEDRKRFVSLVRRALADDIERGESLPPVRVRERVAAAADRSRAAKTRALAREDLDRTV